MRLFDLSESDIRTLAEKLFLAEQKIEPSGDEWSSLDENDRERYKYLVDSLAGDLTVLLDSPDDNVIK